MPPAPVVAGFGLLRVRHYPIEHGRGLCNNDEVRLPRPGEGLTAAS